MKVSCSSDAALRRGTFTDVLVALQPVDAIASVKALPQDQPRGLDAASVHGNGISDGGCDDARGFSSAFALVVALLQARHAGSHSTEKRVRSP